MTKFFKNLKRILNYIFLNLKNSKIENENWEFNVIKSFQ